MWSFAKLQFYRTLLTTGQLLLISSNIFDVSLALSGIYQFSHKLSKNSRNATYKRSLLLLCKCLKEIRKKKQVKSNILGLRLTQWTKVYLVEAVARRCSVKKVPWIFWQNSEKNACTGDLKKLWEAGLPVYLKRDSCIRIFQLFFKNSSEQFFL